MQPGALIPDEMYSPDMEGQSWRSVVVNTKDLTLNHLGLITCLQRIHDDFPVESWRRVLKKFAETKRLKDNSFNFDITWSEDLWTQK